MVSNEEDYLKNYQSTMKELKTISNEIDDLKVKIDITHFYIFNHFIYFKIPLFKVNLTIRR